MKKRAPKRAADQFLDYLYSFRKGEVGDRQRWLAWAAMVTLLAKAGPRERRRWELRFHALSQIEHSATMTDAEQGQAFVDFLAPLWPTRAAPILLNFRTVMAVFGPAWRRGDAARRAALDQILQVNQEKLSLEKDARADIVKCRTPRGATIKLLAHHRGDFDSPSGSEKTTEQALRRARRAAAARSSSTLQNLP